MHNLPRVAECRRTGADPSAQAQEDHLLAADIQTTETTEERTPARRRTVARRPRRGAAGPMRSIAIFAAVGGLVAAVALPAYAATTPVGSEAATSLQQLAETDAQSLVVASETTAAPLDRGTYSA